MREGQPSDSLHGLASWRCLPFRELPACVYLFNLFLKITLLLFVFKAALPNSFLSGAQVGGPA